MESSKPKPTKATTPSDSLVSGQVYPATVAGFTQMVKEADRAVRGGWRIVTMTRLDTHLGILYVRELTATEREYPDFSGEDDLG